MPHLAVPEAVVAGTVRRVLAAGSRAMVRLDDGRTVTVSQEKVMPLVPLDRVLAVGMPVHGLLDASGTELHLAFEAPSGAVLDAVFPDGLVTPALVTQVGELGGELALHPGVRVRVSRRDVSSNPKDRIDTLLTVGETVAARVFRHSDGSLRLRLIDIDDDEPVQPALSLLPRGPEWLVFPPDPEEDRTDVEVAGAEPIEQEPSAAEPEPELAVQVTARSSLLSAQLALDAARAENVRLQRELDAAKATTPAEMRAVRADLGAAMHEAAELGDQLKTSRTELARLREAQRDAPRAVAPTRRDRRERFGDYEAWIRHELYLAWIERLQHHERAEFPLQDQYLIGPAFAASLEALDDDQLQKTFRACVDVLAHRAETMSSRAVHGLRTTASGGAPGVVRMDGAHCMRCAIENDTPSARRLHWWRLRDGGIELSRVVLHDDCTP